MTETGRNYLSGSLFLSGVRDGNAAEKYTIRSVIGEGGSSVCYEAIRTKDNVTETGKLKEFYPVDAVIGKKEWYYSLERLFNGQLVPCAGTIRKFDEMCQEYLDTYRLLRKVIADNPQNEVLKSYIQYGEILYGCNEQDERRATVYIWSPGVAGKGFDVYLEEMKKNSGTRPEEHLREILMVIASLTDCMKALHTAGLMHLDIKPSNFLLQYDSDFKIRPDSISMFDINTLRSINSKFGTMAGTEGYCAPEVMRGNADNRSDIYSIGAMLFQALVICKEIPKGLYQNSYYKNITRLISHSELFQASKINADSRLMSDICKILQKCLAVNPRKRYTACSELKKDLDNAISRLENMIRGRVKTREKNLSEPTAAIQKLLYEHPLYEAAREDAKDIHVLAIGSEIYVQKFIDLCMQVGQMSEKHLYVTVASEEAEKDQESYLVFRPELSTFVDVNGSLEGKEESAYAALEFQDITETPDGRNEKLKFNGSAAQNAEIIHNLTEKAKAQGKCYQYIFIDLGNNKRNQLVAELYAEEVQDACPVCYISETRGKRKKKTPQRPYPVYIGENLDMTEIDRHLEDMAFNAHISWESTMNFDMTEERKKFFEGQSAEECYNRNSSIAYALSIRYKLHSAGIFEQDPMKAAEAFSKEILEKLDLEPETDEQKEQVLRARKIFDRLVDLEHRRWIMEKVTDGWRAPRDADGNLKLEECISRGSVKDTENRTHPCIVRGSETSPLSAKEYEENQHRKWNQGEIDPGLDELDHMSVALHRCFKKYADELRKDSLNGNTDLQLIRGLIPDDCKEGVRAFKQFEYALKNILNGVENYSCQYDYYKKLLEEGIRDLPEEKKVKIKERLKVITHELFPIIECDMYRNYKENDEVLVRKIPFILTYRYTPVMAVVFEDGKYQNGRNEAVFANVAAATVLSPREIHFLYYYNEDSSVDLLTRKLDAVQTYFGKRKVHCAIKMIIACKREIPDEECDLLQIKLKDFQNKYKKNKDQAWFEEGEIFYVQDETDAAEKLEEYLSRQKIDLFDGGNQLFSSPYGNAVFTRKLLEQKIPYFEFDWRNKKFKSCVGCDHLRYVEDKSFIRIQDMFALMNAADNRFYLPEFADDYEKLWSIYTGSYLYDKNFGYGVANWNRLCMALGKYEEEREALAKIAVSRSQNPEYIKFIVFLPEYTFSTAKRVLKKLEEYEIVTEHSEIRKHTSDTCKLEIEANKEYEEQIRRIFFQPQFLLPYYQVDVRKYKKNQDTFVKVTYEDLTVRNADLDPSGDGGKGKEYSYKLLKKLEEAGFVREVQESEPGSGIVSFVYSSPRIKKVLTTAGEILEIYAYYDVLKTGYFDDVASGYEFCWEFGGVKNELDLVLTKGFRSIIVECKAVVELKLDFYHKLHSIADQFGIGTTKVLLGNTYAKKNDVTQDNNTMQRSRGEQLHIRTISEEAEIRSIGETLKKIMEEKVF